MGQQAAEQDIPQQGIPPLALRHLIRQGSFKKGTAGQANGCLQANLVVLPLDWARDFARFCLRNPTPCPVVGLSEPGSGRMPVLGQDLDIRTDVPKYNLYQDGKFVSELETLEECWGDDFVAFALGCSYTFEQALMDAGLSLRHIDQGLIVPMFRTNIKAVSAGRFSGNFVVSMRSFDPESVKRAAEITRAYPYSHGEPVHIGDPAEIGVSDINKPDFGDVIALEAGEIPAFWACGVTPQIVLEAARPPICIAHKPGHMLVSDVRDGEEAMAAWQTTNRQLIELGGS